MFFFPTAFVSLCYSYLVVRMLWWFLILAVSAAVVVSVAISLYLRLRHQLKQGPTRAHDSDSAPPSSSAGA
jgi:hypothetical protein